MGSEMKLIGEGLLVLAGIFGGIAGTIYIRCRVGILARERKEKRRVFHESKKRTLDQKKES